MSDSHPTETSHVSPEPEIHSQEHEAVQFETETTTERGHTSAWSRLWHAGGIVHRSLTFRQKLWRSGGLALTLALVAILFGQQIGSLATNAWNTIHRPAIAQITCLTDGAWSPSGKSLAILGYQGACGQSSHLAGVLNIYDSAGRSLVRRIALDPLLAPAFKTMARAVNTDHIALGQVIWFRGERQLAITFSLPPRSDIGETTTQFGIIVLDPASTNVHPLVYFYEIPNLPGSLYPMPDAGVLWDLKTGQGTLVSGEVRFLAYGNPLELAYRYSWTSTGELIPVTTPNGRDQAMEAIGNPQSDTSFQIWQDGWVAALQQARIPYPLAGAIARWRTTFATASPDGRYVIAPLTMQSDVSPQLAGPAPQAPGASNTLPMLLARDAAFARILRATQKYADRTEQPLIPVAWRPDGKAVATFNLDNDQKVNIYDCATGRLLRSVAEPAQPTQFNGVLNMLRWSPDGHHLLLLDGAMLTL